MSHSRQPHQHRWLRTANIFGTLGYMSIILQWFWAVLLFCYPLIMSDYILLTPTETQAPAPIDSSISTSPIVIFIAACVTVAILILAVIAIIRLPKQIGQQGARVTHQAAKAITPIVTRHITIPKNKRRTLTFQIKIYIKLLCVLAPLIALIWIPIDVPLEAAVVWTAGIFCASWSLFYITTQIIVAKLAKIPKDNLL